MLTLLSLSLSSLSLSLSLSPLSLLSLSLSPLSPLLSEEQVLHHYKMFEKYSRGQAIFHYLEIVQTLQMYSYHYFEVKVHCMYSVL